MAILPTGTVTFLFATSREGQMRYFARFEGQDIALLGFGASACKVAARDHFIGWTHEQRQQKLHLIVAYLVMETKVRL